MRAVDAQGFVVEALAINEVSMLRQSYQAAKLRISVDGQERLSELIADGVLVATPAGSTAYNPVSYTHLDVYKRQDQARPVCLLMSISAVSP